MSCISYINIVYIFSIFNCCYIYACNVSLRYLPVEYSVIIAPFSLLMSQHKINSGEAKRALRDIPALKLCHAKGPVYGDTFFSRHHLIELENVWPLHELPLWAAISTELFLKFRLISSLFTSVIDVGI